VKSIRDRALKREILAGTFLNLGSSLTAEIAGQAGFDWILIDMEHGAGNRTELLMQLQALESSPSVPLVRIAWNDPIIVKQVLDLGAAGIMMPYVQTAEEARRAAASMRYPPSGNRSVAVMNRACGFGPGFNEYFQTAGSRLLTILQIESPLAVDNIDEIAGVDGADVLFVGPMDLSVGLGLPQQWEHPKMRHAIEKVVNASQKAGKTAGTIVSNEAELKRAIADGFTMLAFSSDGAVMAKGMREIATIYEKYKNNGFGER
jgi:4-hydroxy-2-oxoheptanedioate aldolase